MLQTLAMPSGIRNAMPVLISLCILFAWNLPIPAASPEEAQTSEYLVDVWDIQDGLPHSTITGIVQTPDGYLWCSTHDGVVRFDGVRFVRVAPDDPNNANANRIFCLHADRSGQLWLGTDGGGLLRYANGTFTTFAGKEGSPGNIVFSLAEDAAGSLWVGTRAGLGRWSNGQITWFTEANGFTNAPRMAQSLAFDRNGHLWMADFVSLKVFQDGRFTTGLSRPEVKSQGLRTIHPDSAGNIWAGALGSMVWRRHDGEWSAVEEIGKLPSPATLAFCETLSGDLWLGMPNGLMRGRNGTWRKVGINENLINADVRVITEDREGNLWVGTGGGGLARFKRRSVLTYAGRQGLTDERVQALCEKSGGGLWVGASRGGLFHGIAGDFKPYEPIPNLPLDAPVASLLRARDGALWIGTYGNGLWRHDAGGLLGFSFVASDYAPAENAPGSPVPVNKITALLEDRSTNIWVGTYFGVYKPISKNTLAPVPIGGRFVKSHVTALHGHPGGGVWVGYHGLGLAHVMDSEARWLTHRDGLPTDFVRALHQDKAGNLWIGTTAGLCRSRDGQVRTFTKRHGLIDETISQILDDDAGNLWLGSNQGIMRVSKQDLEGVASGRKSTLEVLACGRGEGMLSPECSGGFSPAGLRTTDGRLWFPTAKGLVMVDPSQLALNKDAAPPPVYLEEVRLDGKSLLSAPLLGRGATSPVAIELPPGPRRLEFSYTALSLTAPERVRFKHRLEGFDGDWIESGSARSVVYPKLASGHYRFQVVACNNAGIWNETGASLALVVPPYFWQTWWFMGLGGLGGVIGFGALVRFVSHRKLQGKLRLLEQQHALEKERTRIARDMHDELGGKLTRISYQGAMARQCLANPLEAGQQLDKIAQTAHELASSLDEIVWAVDPDNDSLDYLADYICRYAGEFFGDGPIRCQLIIPPKLPDHHLATDVRHNVFLAIKEALHNALKHSGAKCVEIRLSTGAGEFEILISDDGRGFDPNPNGGAATGPARRTGHGLTNFKERMAAIHGRSELTSEVGKGTRVRFVVPLK
jgi:ligand-binding sensor domain-containing protein/signal transduction histidine kinase